MKKKQHTIAALGVFAASFVFVLFLMIADASAQLLDRSLSLRDLAFQLKTPENIAHYMWRHFDFEDDQRQFGTNDYWQSPEEFLKNKKGDCEDFAWFAYELLKINGVRAYLFNIYGSQFAHTVCIFREKDKYGVLDGTDVYRFNAKNLRDLITKIYPFWKTTAMVVPSEHSKKAHILSHFERHLQAEYRLAISA